jgi:plasmid maintenance system killer protein
VNPFEKEKDKKSKPSSTKINYVGHVINSLKGKEPTHTQEVNPFEKEKDKKSKPSSMKINYVRHVINSLKGKEPNTYTGSEPI